LVHYKIVACPAPGYKNNCVHAAFRFICLDFLATLFFALRFQTFFDLVRIIRLWVIMWRPGGFFLGWNNPVCFFSGSFFGSGCLTGSCFRLENIPLNKSLNSFISFISIQSQFRKFDTYNLRLDLPRKNFHYHTNISKTGTGSKARNLWYSISPGYHYPPGRCNRF